MHNSLKNNKYYEPHTHTHSRILVTTIWSTSPVLQSCVEGWSSHERDEVHVVHQRTVWWRFPSESSSFPSCFLLSSSLNHFNWVRLVQFVTESNELGSEPFAVCLQWACSLPCHHRKDSQRTCSSKTHTHTHTKVAFVSRCFSCLWKEIPDISWYFHQWSNQHSRPWLPRPKRQGFGRVAGFPSLGRNYWLEKTGNCLKLLERLEVRKSQMNSSFEMQCVLAKNMSKDYSSSILLLLFSIAPEGRIMLHLFLLPVMHWEKNCEWHKWRQSNFSVRIVWAPAKARCQCSKNVQACSSNIKIFTYFYWDMSVYWSYGDMYTLLCRTGNAFPPCSLGSFLPRCTIWAEMIRDAQLNSNRSLILDQRVPKFERSLIFHFLFCSQGTLTSSN